MTFPCRPRLIVCLLPVMLANPTGVFASSFPPADAYPDLPAVTTFAGSGALGISDGPAATATFLSPVDVSYADDGTLYVADRDAQRIRAISPNGVVRTVAGSGDVTALGIAVTGGYADGPGLQARFSMPQGVIAMADGAVIVADTKNFCIRRIAHGSVTTLAGSHDAYGSDDGVGGAARFRNPRSLARGANGMVYVTDWQNGVRRIDPSGRVTTLRFADSASVIAIAIPKSDPNLLVAATSAHVETVRLDSLKIVNAVPLDSNFAHVAAREAGRTIGPVGALAAFDGIHFVTVDPLDSALRYVAVSAAIQNTYTRTLTASPDENAAYGSAGFADGAGSATRFDQPLGIALSSDGHLAVADTGNRRVRLVGLFDRRTHVDTDVVAPELPSIPDPRITRIALLGNSDIWFDQAWHESVPGALQDRLGATLGARSKPVVVYPVMRFGLAPLAGLEYIDDTLGSGVVDAVVFDLPTFGETVSESDAGIAFPPNLRSALRDKLIQVAKDLERSHIAFLVVVHPGPADFPDEFEYRRMAKGDPTAGGGDTVPLRDALLVQTKHDDVLRAVSDSGVASIDLWPAFLQAYASTNRAPLFEAWDHHLSPQGRSIVSTAIADRIAPMLRATSDRGDGFPSKR